MPGDSVDDFLRQLAQNYEKCCLAHCFLLGTDLKESDLEGELLNDQHIIRAKNLAQFAKFYGQTLAENGLLYERDPDEGLLVTEDFNKVSFKIMNFYNDPEGIFMLDGMKQFHAYISRLPRNYFISIFQ